MQARPGHTDMCKENIVAEKEDKQVNQSNMNMGEGSKSSEENHEHLHNEIHLPRGISSEIQEYVAGHIRLADKMSTLTRLEEDTGHRKSNTMVQNKEKQVLMNLDEKTQAQDEDNGMEH
ncbi:uncharacterized protein LOC110723803 [Chenopodium quinoa]|uniref:uncharacterized protein LOC110723803 n=1 Tax=Chenopodium quinoa TaxID=63459 RepID=UPI000B789382|nr:uncharacterized protein LOC110723803 [Chenopodium quinoa]